MRGPTAADAAPSLPARMMSEQAASDKPVAAAGTLDENASSFGLISRLNHPPRCGPDARAPRCDCRGDSRHCRHLVCSLTARIRRRLTAVIRAMATPPQFERPDDLTRDVTAVKVAIKHLNPNDRARIIAWMLLYYQDDGAMFSPTNQPAPGPHHT